MARKSKQQRKKYKGALAKEIIVPMQPDPPQILFEKIGIEELAAKYKENLDQHAIETATITVEERFKKMFLLLEHYELKYEGEITWFKLAYEMAVDRVQGFSIKEENQYSRDVWNLISYAKLYFDVHREMESLNTNNKKPKPACDRLIKKEPWSVLLTPKNKHHGEEPKAATLYKQYSAAKKSPLILGFNDPKNKSLRSNEGQRIYIEGIDNVFSDYFKNSTK